MPTGSQNFLLMKSISQTLAGRCAIFHLLPFSMNELRQLPQPMVEGIGQKIPSIPEPKMQMYSISCLQGFIPELTIKSWMLRTG
ncbi:MAG: hypothetical protein R2874_02460 [Desulfobacterales bacterium]